MQIIECYFAVELSTRSRVFPEQLVVGYLDNKYLSRYVNQKRITDCTRPLIRVRQNPASCSQKKSTIMFTRTHRLVHKNPSSCSPEPILLFTRTHHLVHNNPSFVHKKPPLCSPEPNISFTRTHHRIHQNTSSLSPEPTIFYTRIHHIVHKKP
jgi:hypothetical protein